MSNQVELSVNYIPNPSIGRALSLADIYVGVVDLDPKIVGNQKQISVLQEDGTTVEVSQPITTSAGGVPLYNGAPVTILVEGSYSIRIDDSSGAQQYYVPKNAELESLNTFDTIADMRTITETPTDGDTFTTLGYRTKGDGGWGQFYWDSLSTETDNDVTIIKATAITTGRWKRLYETLNLYMFGLGTSQTAAVNADAFNRALALAIPNGEDLIVPPGIYDCDPIVYSKTSSNNDSGITIRGPKGNDEVQDGTSYLDFSGLSGAQKAFEFYDQGTGGQLIGLTLRDIALFGPGISNTTIGIHVHSTATGNGIRHLNLKNVAVERFNIGVKIEGDGSGAGYDNWPLYTQSLHVKDCGINLYLGSGNTVGNHDLLDVNNSSLGTVGIYMQAPVICQNFNAPVIQQTTYGVVFDTLEADGSLGNIRGITMNSPYFEGVQYGLRVGYQSDGTTPSGVGSAKSFVINGGQYEDPTPGGSFISNSLGTLWRNNVFNALEIDDITDIVGNPSQTTLTSNRINEGNPIYYNASGFVTSPVVTSGSTNVFRLWKLSILDGTIANALKCSGSSTFNLNGDDILEEDDITKGTGGARFDLDATGSILTVEGTAMSGLAKGCFSSIMKNGSTTGIVVKHEVVSDNIVLTFTNSTTGAAVDLTALVDVGDIEIGMMVINEG